MPVPPSIKKSIKAFRAFIARGGGGGKESFSPYALSLELFRNPGRILKSEETLDAVLALAPEIEAYRGKGSQIIQKSFNRSLTSLLFHARLETAKTAATPDLFSIVNESPDPPASAPFWAEKLSDYFLERVQGKPVRSVLAGRLKSNAWMTLGELSHVCRRPAHLALALETAADKRRPDVEREGAIQFLAAYWADEDPDKATIDLLEDLRLNPPNRDFLVIVLQVRIELGLDDAVGALFDVDDWDDAEDWEDNDEEE